LIRPHSVSEFHTVRDLNARGRSAIWSPPESETKWPEVPPGVSSLERSILFSRSVLLSRSFPNFRKLFRITQVPTLDPLLHSLSYAFLSYLMLSLFDCDKIVIRFSGRLLALIL